jgi:phosphatidylserine decarboxylase
VARLCPVDYHRFHFPDDGRILDHYRIPGFYHSVNPLALKKKSDIFITNERHVTSLDTVNFGKLAYIEVGALCVGKIVQSFTDKVFKRGEEKGYFLFGASTVVLVGQKGLWSPSQDVLENTEKGLETYIKLGDQVGIKI